MVIFNNWCPLRIGKCCTHKSNNCNEIRSVNFLNEDFEDVCNKLKLNCDYIDREEECAHCTAAKERDREFSAIKCDNCGKRIGNSDEVTLQHDYFEIGKFSSAKKVCKGCYIKHMNRYSQKGNKQLTDKIERALIDYYLLRDHGREFRIISQFTTVHGSKSNREDLVIINVVPSKWCITSIEIKTLRSDFLKDLKNFEEKHKDALAFSNKIYYAAPAGLIAPSELPEGVGLFVYRENENTFYDDYCMPGRISIFKHAKQRKIDNIDLKYVISFLTRMTNLVFPMKSFMGKDYLVLS